MQPMSNVSTEHQPTQSGPSERREYAPPPGFVRYRLEVQWDGGGFVGWQSQPGQRSVQDTLQAALPGNVQAARPVAAGRTDAGVHAEAMTLHWDIAETLRLSPERLHQALNGRLPSDLAVLSLSVTAAWQRSETVMPTVPAWLSVAGE